MTVRIMEGFETIRQNADLVQRGQSVAATDSNVVGTTAASYAGGTALTRVFTGSQLLQQDVGNLGSGLSFVTRVKATGFNNFTLSRKYLRYVNGSWVAPCAAISAILYSSVSDPLKLDTQITVSADTSTVAANDIIWDPDNNDYLFAQASNTTRIGFYHTSSLSTNFTPITGVTVTSSASIIGGFFYAPTLHSLFYYTRSNIIKRTSASAFTSVYSNSNSFVLGGIVYTGSKLIAAAGTSNTLVTSTDGNTWTASTYTVSGDITSFVSTGIAYGNGKVLVVNAQGGIAYSSDDGITFVSKSAATTGLPSASLVVAYGNGVFVAIANSSDNKVYLSIDAVTWTSYTMSHNISAQQISLTYEHDRFVLTLANTSNANIEAHATSMDGINWSWTECGVISSSSTPNSVTGFRATGFEGTYYYGYYTNTNGSVFGLRAGTSNNGVQLPAPFSSITRDTWYSLNVQLVPTSAASFTASFNVNSINVGTYTVPYTQFSGYNLVTGSYTPTNRPGFYDASTNIAVLPVSASAVLDVSYDGGFTWTPKSKPNAANIALKVNGIWCTGGSGLTVIDVSTDLNTWTTVPTGLSSSATFINGYVYNGVAMFATGVGVVRSTDGLTWTQVGQGVFGSFSTPVIGAIGDTWVFANSTTTWYYSKDEGLTWTPFTSPGSVGGAGAAVCVTAAFGALWFTTSSSGQLWRLVPNSGNNPPTVTASIASGAGGLAPAGLAFNGKYLAFSTSSTTTLCYSADGTNWSTATAAVGPALLAINETFIQSALSTAIRRVIYPDAADLQFHVAFDTGGNSFSAYDDLVVTDFTAPNVGDVGDARVLIVPSDTDEQVEWTKVPDTIPTNAEAATELPISLATSYVEANEAGQKDIYGTSAFTVPAGFRPIAMEIEGNFERIFSNTPQIKMGIINNGEENETPIVNINSTPGSRIYVSKIVETNPDGDVPWSSADIANTQISITKVS